MSYGVIKAEASQQQRVARHMRFGEKVDSAMRRIRRFVAHVRFPLNAFFVEWIRGVMSGLGTPAQVRLVVDETKLHDRRAVMLVGLAWEGRCVPLVWRAYRANDAAAYPAEG